MKYTKAFLVKLTILAVFTFALPQSHYVAGNAHAQMQNHNEARVQKNKAQKALLQAMELNARVEMLIKQGVNEVDKMMQLLDQSYSLQAVAINQMEWFNRAAKFKDPMVARGIQDMYDNGKPSTMKARSNISVGDFDTALAHLASAKLVHQRFLIITY